LTQASHALCSGICGKGLVVQVEGFVVAALAFAVSCALTGMLRARAASRGLMDVPNERSSHQVPTPRGGGAAIVVTLNCALIALTLLGVVERDLLIALGGGGTAVGLVGFLDDRYHLPASTRLTVHFIAALWALIWLHGLPPIRLGSHVVHFGLAGYLIGAIGIVWVLNLFNFMDGIDGIAASEACFIGWAGAALSLAVGIGAGVVPVGAAFGAACAGFLVWNWPPARIFLGDVGSGYLGFVVAVIALVVARESAVALLVWLILGGVFFVDATVTFLRRFARGDKVHVAHRSHAYQWLARSWKSHRNVTLLTVAINFLWLLPFAWAALQFPEWGGWLTLLALVPLAIGTALAGAGRSEAPPAVKE
jgi:Fuc2NAc and GlcNAc transferase